MIYYNSRTKSFLLSGKNYSYCMYINRAGLLQHLYWGKKIGAADAAFLVAAHGLPASPNPDDYNKDMATDGMPSECGSFGRGDFRPATVIVRQNDGAAMSRFMYVSHKIVKGALHLQGMPCARKADETLVITMSAAEGDFEGERACHERDITIKYHCLKDVGMVRRVTVNGEEVPFKRTKREAGAFPLDTSLSAPDAHVVGVSFLADVAKEQSVVFLCE